MGRRGCDGQGAGNCPGGAWGEKIVGERADPNQRRRARCEGCLDLMGWYGERLGREYQYSQRAENQIIGQNQNDDDAQVAPSHTYPPFAL